MATTGSKVSASHGDDLVQVATFKLAKPYDPSLFERVRPEIEQVAKQLASQLKATTTERTVTVAGQRALQFDLGHDGKVEQTTFVLRGRTEYQLYCRRADATPCKRLVATFTTR